MVKKIFSYLKSAGIDVYLPGKKLGKCVSAYAVVKEDKSEISASGKGLYTYFKLSIIAPLDSYSVLDSLTARAKAALADTKLKFFESADEEAGDDFNGYKRVLTYRIFKPIKCRRRQICQ